MSVSKKIKIACIFDNFFPKLGGEPIQNQTLVENLHNSEKFSPVVFPLMWEQGLDTNRFDFPVHPVRTYTKFPDDFNKVTPAILWDRAINLLRSKSIRRHLAAIDIILTDLHSAALIGAYYKNSLGKKLAIRFGGNVFRQGEDRHEIEDKYHWLKGYFFQIPARYAFNAADRIIVNGHDLHTELTDVGFDGGKIHIIPVGFSPDIFFPPPASHEELLVADNTPLRILFYGRITEANGPLQFVEIISSLLRQTDQTVAATVIGDGPLLYAMKKNAERQRLPITFLARQSQKALANQIRAHQFCVFPFRKIGGVSSVITESMACGRIVFTTNSGDMANVIQDRVNGFLFPIDNPFNIANAIITVAKEQELQKTVSANAIESVRQDYTWPSVTEKYITVLSQLARS